MVAGWDEDGEEILTDSRIGDGGEFNEPLALPLDMADYMSLKGPEAGTVAGARPRTSTPGVEESTASRSLGWSMRSGRARLGSYNSTL